ncbi:hypothetical protein BDB01DRAFT_791186, partial [Pilobolus umbonatus]
MLLHRSDSTPSLHSKVNERDSITTMDSIKNIITKLEEDMDGIHKANTENYHKSQMANNIVTRVKELGDIHYNICDRMEHLDDDINSMKEDISAINISAINLKNIMMTLEDEINAATMDYEQKQFESWKQEQERELMKHIEMKRNKIKEKERILKARYEEYDKIQQQKKVELYEATFNAELEEYRRRRMTEVSSLYTNNDHVSKDNNITSLEELQLDNSSKDELESFFGSDDEVPLTKDKQKNREFDDHKGTDGDEENIEILPDEDYS